MSDLAKDMYYTNALNQLYLVEMVTKMPIAFIKWGKVQVLSALRVVSQKDLMNKFGMDSSQVSPKCPNCGATMSLVQRKDGGGIFWSCINWRTKGCKGYNVDEVDIDGTYRCV